MAIGSAGHAEVTLRVLEALTFICFEGRDWRHQDHAHFDPRLMSKVALDQTDLAVDSWQSDACF
jgi:hypothetical protein